MYRLPEYKAYFRQHKSINPATFNTYNSYLNRIDRAIGGLDERIKSDGIDAVLSWGRASTSGPFETYPSHARSVLKSYLEFHVHAEGGDDEAVNETSEEGSGDAAGTVFRLENEMQAAVRRQLSNLEAGLREADGGGEVSVSTGRIDILAEDAAGRLVVIELKAGVCPPGALEQVLGYAEALAEERNRQVRAILVASEFPDRIRAAAKRARDVELRTYQFSMQFSRVA